MVIKPRRMGSLLRIEIRTNVEGLSPSPSPSAPPADRAPARYPAPMPTWIALAHPPFSGHASNENLPTVDDESGLFPHISFGWVTREAEES